MSQAPTVYVVAATGTQGSAVCRQLRQIGWGVHATARNLDSPQAQALADLGVVLNAGGWDDEDALVAGLSGCEKMFLALTPNYRDLDVERVWAQKILALAKVAGVSDIVYSSSISADAPEKRTLVPADHLIVKSLFCKNIIEGLVQRAGFAHWTILRPGFFMSNLLDPKVRMYPELFERGTWLTAMTADTRLNLIDPEDIAVFAVAALRDSERFHSHGIDLVGERLTPAQIMQAVSDAAGRNLKAAFYTEEEISQAASTNPLIGAQVFLRDGDKYVDAGKVKAWGIPMGSLKDFLAREKAAVNNTYN